jgi:hypothetical protein
MMVCSIPCECGTTCVGQTDRQTDRQTARYAAPEMYAQSETGYSIKIQTGPL